MIKIFPYLNTKLISFFEAESRDEAIRYMVDTIHQHGHMEDQQAFYQAIIERENIVSTGIGMGVAIPHAKLSYYDHFFIAVGILKKGVDWNAIDGTSVRLIFMIGGPDDKQTEYLQILSSLTKMIKDEQLRKKMLTINSAEEITHLLQPF